ncbi:MAG TPA: SDR family oxidoreductase [Firmicutes bacterium]|jgi:2-deoxy-D-gluconate 3-dehydrogenase|nr:SDR family oxidoreductase [Bacillota bacterium]
MTGRMTGKAAIVTGGALGIGFGIVRRFVQEGAGVLLVDLNEEAARAAAGKLAAGPGRVEVYPADVGSEETGEKVVARCVEVFGGLDILVNNAGIFPQAPVLKMAPELLDRVYRVNLKGLVLTAKAAALQMVAQGRGGRIINIASIDAFRPSMVGLAAYDASKGGVVMFTKSLALELAPHNITVNAVAPGAIYTEGVAEAGVSMEEFAKRIPLRRVGKPEDIAGAVAFLASTDAEYITGETIVVDGGALLT